MTVDDRESGGGGTEVTAEGGGGGLGEWEGKWKTAKNGFKTRCRLRHLKWTTPDTLHALAHTAVQCYFLSPSLSPPSSVFFFFFFFFFFFIFQFSIVIVLDSFSSRCSHTGTHLAALISSNRSDERASICFSVCLPDCVC